MAFVDFYRSRDGRRLLLRQGVALAAVALALTLGFGDGKLDLAIERRFFDAASHAFPLTNQWFLKTLLHDAARTASAVAALALVGLTVTCWVTSRPLALRAHREALLFTSISTVAAAATVAVLKHFSSHACPWDLALFGGTAAYHPLLGVHAGAAGVDGCFPAAHPLAGYAWLALGFALYPTAPRSARRWWTFAFIAGSLFGGVQVARGAHFVSHVLWAAWIAWGVNVGLLGASLGISPRRRDAISRAGSAEPGSARRAASCLYRLP